MKRSWTVILAVCCFNFAKAQHTANSVNPADAAPDANANAPVNLTLHNAIEINPPMNYLYSATLVTAADFNGLTSASDMGTNTWHIKSTKAGKISLAFSNLMSTPALATIIPASKMSYSVDNGSSWNPAALSVPSAATFGSGDNIEFKMRLKVNPGWSYQGGVYGGWVTVTATQL